MASWKIVQFITLCSFIALLYYIVEFDWTEPATDETSLTEQQQWSVQTNKEQITVHESECNNKFTKVFTVIYISL